MLRRPISTSTTFSAGRHRTPVISNVTSVTRTTLRPERIDDLLIEQVANHAQHVLVGVIRSKLFVPEIDALERDGSDLVVADAEPGPSAAYQEAVDPRRIDERNKCGVSDTADLAGPGCRTLAAR